MKDEKLGKRLAYWAQQLRCNKAYPWVGMGLIEDLETAAVAHGAKLLTAPAVTLGQVAPIYAANPITSEIPMKEVSVEYDL